jgi:transposase
MQAITTIDLEIAKSVFQVHGVDADGQVVVRRQLKRRYVLAFFEKLAPCLIGIEACASSHHWSRQLQALGHGPRGRQRDDAISLKHLLHQPPLCRSRHAHNQFLL